MGLRVSGLSDDSDGSTSAVTIRQALPSELEILKAIDDDSSAIASTTGAKAAERREGSAFPD